MLKIKLARFGKRKQPHYRIVVNEARDKRDGQYIDIVGHYEPSLIPKTLIVEMEKVHAWIKKGAQPTDTVQSLIARFQSGNPFPARKPGLSKKARAKAAAAAEAAKAPAETTTVETKEAEVAVTEAPTTETPAAETPAAPTETTAE